MNALRRIALDVAPLRESPPFRRLWTGQVVSFFGAAMTYVAVPYQVFQLTHSTLAVGMLYLCVLVPQIVVPLFGGAVADACDRRRVVLVTESVLAAVSVAFAVNAALPQPYVWLLYVLQTIGGAAFGFGMPAMQAIVPRLVGDDRIAAAAALEDLYANVGAIAGPTLGGVLIATAGLSAAYAVDALTFAASIAAIRGLPALPAEAGEEDDDDRVTLGAIAAGLRYVRRAPAVLGSLLADTNAMVFGMPFALFPALAEQLGGGAAATGLLYSAPAAGAVVAALGSGWVSRVRRLGLGVLVATSCWGAALAGLGFAPSLAVAVGFVAIAGAADFFSGVLRSALVLGATPDAMRGRVAGIEFAQVASAPSLGNLEAGAVASLTSVRFSIVSGGLACIVGNVVLALALPAFLHYSSSESPADVEVEATPIPA